MDEYADLEISLHRQSASSYALEMRFNQPGSDADIRLSKEEPALATFDLNQLNSLIYDPDAYGKALTQGLFADPAVKTAFAQVLSSAQSLNAPVRLRLLVGLNAHELLNLHWETLRDPQDGRPLTTSESLFFSRYLSSLDWRPVRLRPKGNLRALVFLANPANLSEYDLAEIDVAGESARAQAGLGNIPVSALPDGDNGKRATLENLISLLREGDSKGPFDILYLVCHGAFVKDEPWLWLEDQDGNVARTSGEDLVTRLKELQQHPRLVILASCQSAGDTAGKALSALGPRLAEAGVPAVIAMQGKVSMQTISEFMPVFFEQLQRDGQIDRATAVARGTVRNRPDYWMPILFMRLKSGRIWYVPGFGEDRAGFEKWPTLVRGIERDQVTPILGPGLFEPILGSLREIARRWAETYRYPMAPHERESLPQVAQYLAINQNRRFPFEELEEYMQNELQRQYSQDLPAQKSRRGALDSMIETVGALYRQRDPLEPHKILAQLPLSIYITTNADCLMASALADAGRDPQVVVCPWNEYVEQSESIYNYFDFLIGITSNNNLIPPAIRRALTDTSLLFLGFQMDDWNFRVLFRSILSREGGGRRDLYAHMAAQIEPEEGRILEPERARRYLENYFSKGAAISIYWGSTADFVKELLGRLNQITH
jgi:hypothetical protein